MTADDLVKRLHHVLYSLEGNWEKQAAVLKACVETINCDQLELAEALTGCQQRPKAK